MSGKYLSLTLTGLVLLSGTLMASNADAASVTRKYRYFPVYGKTAEQLDRSLAKNGPKLGDGGESHPGATKIAFDARVKYRYDGKYCRISDVRANVTATVSLPSWKNRRRASADTRMVWDVLVKDIRRHEESHIVIARSHASELEYRIRAMRNERDCATLRANVDKITNQVFASHDKAQQHFDLVETVNFETRFERLITNSLEKRYQQQKKS
jgi:predicted secreted Zn-dependent protease